MAVFAMCSRASMYKNMVDSESESRANNPQTLQDPVEESGNKKVLSLILYTASPTQQYTRARTSCAYFHVPSPQTIGGTYLGTYCRQGQYEIPYSPCFTPTWLPVHSATSPPTTSFSSSTSTQHLAQKFSSTLSFHSTPNILISFLDHPQSQVAQRQVEASELPRRRCQAPQQVE